MKIHALLQILCVSGSVFAAQPEIGPDVVDKGAHHRSWARAEARRLSNGTTVIRTNSYLELETGMHYWKDGQWQESREIVEAFPGGAIARQGRHNVIFNNNVNEPGAVDVLTGDGKRLRSHVVCILYTDARSGGSVLLAGVKDRQGQIVDQNKVVYEDAFDNVLADIRYTYTKAGLEQDILIREPLPPPETLGLEDDTTFIEIVTEFIEAPEPIREVSILRAEQDPLRRAQMAEPDFVDEHLSFGEFQMSGGQAFAIRAGQADEEQIAVGKLWLKTGDRRFLVERVPYSSGVAVLVKLAPPKNRQMVANIKRSAEKSRSRVLSQVGLQAKLGPSQPKGKAMEYAALENPPHGFLVDYRTLTSSFTDYTFSNNTTTVINGNVVLSGTTVFEGGTVIKFANTNTAIENISLDGPAECRGSLYAPVILTGLDDDTVGETISGSMGKPDIRYYAAQGLNLNKSAQVYNLTNIVFRYLRRAATVGPASFLNLKDAMFLQCSNALRLTGKETRLQNALAYKCPIVLEIASSPFPRTNHIEHLTAHYCYTLASAACTNYITNSLFIAVTNGVFYASGQNVETNLSDTGIFESAAAGAHYLPTGSPYRNVGTTNIATALKIELAKRTTYAPALLTNTFLTDTILTPLVSTDSDTPDLGFHYAPVDYVVRNLTITNSVLAITPGVRIAAYGGDGDIGLRLTNNSTLICTGRVDNPCQFVHYALVQEQATTNSLPGPLTRIIDTPMNASTPNVNVAIRFAKSVIPAGVGEHFRGGFADEPVFRFQDSEFTGGTFTSDYPQLVIANCLFDRVATTLYEQGSDVYSCLFRAGSLDVATTSIPHNVTNNIFDFTYITQSGAVTNKFNGYNNINSYLAGAANRFTPTNSGDVIVSSIAYDVGSLGRYYRSDTSAFVDTGSTNANLLGLYHYTTTTNNVTDASSRVDIGYHYVATESDGTPLDSDDDGSPDYLEDLDGNNVLNSGETLRTSAADAGLRVLITRPREKLILP